MPPSNRITAFIDANPRGFKRGISQAQNSLNGFKRSITGILAAGGATAAVRSLDQLATNAIRAGDSIGKAAKVANIGAEALQQYRFAAVLAGSTQKELDDAVGRFTRRLGEARRGNKEYEKTFSELGVTVSDTNEQAIGKVFKSLADVEDVTIRTSLATKVFGDDARRMALLVRDGAEGLDRMTHSARDLRVVLGDDAVAALEQARSTLSTLNQQLSTKLQTTVANNIEGFIRFKTLMNDIASAAVTVASKIGNAAESVERFFDAFPGATIRSDADSSALRRREEILQKRLDGAFDALNRKRGELDSGIGNVPGIRQLLEKDIAFLEKRAASAALELVQVRARLSRARGATGIPLPATPSDPVVPDFTGITVPNIPRLSTNVFAEEAERAGDAIQQALQDAERLNELPLVALRDLRGELEALLPQAENMVEFFDISEALEGVNGQMLKLREATEGWRIASERAGEGIAVAFAGAIAFGDDLGKTLERLAQQLAFEGLLDIFRGALGLQTADGGAFNLIFGGGRASGGPVQAGRAFLVGEQGPELFVPGASGAIVPNDGFGGGVVVNQTLRFDVGLESVDQRIADTTPVIAVSVMDAVDRVRRRPRFA